MTSLDDPGKHPQVAPALPEPDEIREIACLMLAGIGDLLAASPTLHALKARYPQARITLVMRPRLIPLMVENPDVDAFVRYERGGFGQRLAFFRQLRRQRFDLWVDLHTPTFHTVSSANKVFLRNTLLMLASRSRYRLGYSVPMMRPHLTHSLPVPDHDSLAGENIVTTTLALAGVRSATPAHKRMTVAEQDLAWARQQLEPYGGLKIGLFFGGRQPANHWPIPRLKAFVSSFLDCYPDAHLLFLGDIHESALAAELINGLEQKHRNRIVNLISKTELGQTAAVLKLCQAAVCTDSGPMHIADAVGTPLVALFSGKNYLPVWVPTGEQTTVLNHPVACSPCFQSHCHIGNRCMDLIEPREVMVALSQLLARKAVSSQ